MNPTVITYSIYIILALAATIGVARTLFRHGRAFLLDAFHRDEDLADSVNHLLVVGFYLVNAGFICLYLKTADAIHATQGIFESVASKMGVVLLVLGAMHFLNLALFRQLRRRHLLDHPPVPPSRHIETPA